MPYITRLCAIKPHTLPGVHDTTWWATVCQWLAKNPKVSQITPTNIVMWFIMITKKDVSIAIYETLQFLNNVIVNKTKVLLPQVILADFGYLV